MEYQRERSISPSVTTWTWQRSRRDRFQNSWWMTWRRRGWQWARTFWQWFPAVPWQYRTKLSSWTSRLSGSIHRRPSKVQAVAAKGPASAYEGQCPHDQDEAIGPGLLGLQGPDLYKLHAQGDHSQCQLHCGGPGYFYEDFLEKESRDGGWRLDVLLGQSSGSHCCQGDGLDGGQTSSSMSTGHIPPPPSGRRLLVSQSTQDLFKKEREGAVWSTIAADFAEAFRWWFRRHEQCVAIGGGYVKKS